MSAGRLFPFERYTVYQRAMTFYALSAEIERSVVRHSTYLADQLGRAAMSIVLNIAEGSGEYRAGERARFLRIALRSAQECAGILAIARVRHFAPEPTLLDGRNLLNEIVALLTTMITRPQKPRNPSTPPPNREDRDASPNARGADSSTDP